MDTEASIRSERTSLREGRTEIDLWKLKYDQRRKEEQDWRTAAQKAIDIFDAKKGASRAYNILHANVTVEIPSLFNSLPVPDFRKRYPQEPEEVNEEAIVAQAQQQAQMMAQQQAGQSPDIDAMIEEMTISEKSRARRDAEKADRVFKRASDIIERVVVTTMDLYPFDEVVEDAVHDHCVTGRGVVRVKYDPNLFTWTDEETGEIHQEVGAQTISCEIVSWDDYTQGPGKVWERIPWVDYRHNLPEDEVRALLTKYAELKGFEGDDLAVEVERRIEALPFGSAKKSKDPVPMAGGAPAGIEQTLEVHETWCRKSKRSLFWTEFDREDYLLAIDDPIGLRGFFPQPAPLRRIRRGSSTLEPMTSFQVYESLADELDDITKRISKLMRTLRVRGLVDPVLKEAMAEMEGLEDGQYATGSVGSENWKLGSVTKLQDLVHQFPMDGAIAALARLYEQREMLKQTIYEVTGISDVLRGATNPNETLGAQQLKANYGSQRTQKGQKAVSNFCRDLLRIKSEIICKHFTTENLSAMSGMTMTPEVEQIIRDDAMMLFSFDIETDSTIRADIVRNQEQWKGFLEGTAQFGQSLGVVAPLMPKVVPHLVELYGAFVERMKLGRKADDVVKRMVEAATEFADASPAAGSDKSGQSDEEMAMQREMAEREAQAAEQERQVKREEMQATLQDKAAARDHEARMGGVEIRRATDDAARETQKFQMEMAKAMRELQQSQAVHAMTLQQMAAKLKIEMVKAAGQDNETEPEKISA